MDGRKVSEDDILLRLNLLTPGVSISEQVLVSNIDAVIALLRDNGYFDAKVTPEKKQLPGGREVEILLRVEPGAHARVGGVEVRIEGYDSRRVERTLKLRQGSMFTRDEMVADFERIRRSLRDGSFLAARLEEPRPVLNRTSNTVDILFAGKAGPPVKVGVTATDADIDEKDLVKLLSKRGEGTLDYSAVIEGERILEERFQEKGYFFADVTAKCSVSPTFREDEASYTTNDTELLCAALGGADLTGRKVSIEYVAELGNRLKLVDIRIRGLEDFLVDEAQICRIDDGDNNLGRKLPISEVKALLGSTEASLIGLIPYLGYGRGYTSSRILAEDEETVRSLLSELGYRDAKVISRQGVSLRGDELIITFDVEPGQRTRVSAVEFNGNVAFTDRELREELLKDFKGLEGKGYSRALARNAARKLSEFYSQRGFYDARVNYSIENVAGSGGRNDVRLVFEIENEGTRVRVNQVLVGGNVQVRREAVIDSVALRPGRTLKASDIFSSEQDLYATDVFKRVEIGTEPAGVDGNGERLADVGISVEEQKTRVITYGGGYSTDSGPFGSFDIRSLNLFGRLYQGGAQVRVSRLRQLVQADFINPRFIRNGAEGDSVPRYSPLTLRVQYQRDSTVTRFFRSVFDKGTFGIVQRVDENGNPIDEFGQQAGDPTINRLSLSAETSRTISVRDRMLVFARVRYEDVRLFNFESLLIKDLLRPDSRVRIAGFGFNFVRDTRENCRLRYSLVEIATKGTSVSRCRYNPGDATRGSYLTAEYNVSLPALGASVGFQKFQSSFNAYYSPRQLGNTTLAGRAVLGLASVFSGGGQFTRAGFSELNGVLPISERFFGGGSQSLRGFDFESAGPRVVISPQGVFRDGDGRTVTLNPFTVPFGGNAVALVNLEARIPVADSVRVVPFYDGGNVFRKATEVFNPIPSSEPDRFKRNLRAAWTNTFGIGLRLKTPIGGEFAVDYGYLLNPPTFLIPQASGPDGVFRLHQGQLHFRFAQAF